MSPLASRFLFSSSCCIRAQDTRRFLKHSDQHTGEAYSVSLSQRYDLPLRQRTPQTCSCTMARPHAPLAEQQPRPGLHLLNSTSILPPIRSGTGLRRGFLGLRVLLLRSHSENQETNPNCRTEAGTDMLKSDLTHRNASQRMSSDAPSHG